MRLTEPDAPKAIADLLGARLADAPFRVPQMPPGLHAEPGSDESAPVYQVSLASQEHGAGLVVLLWPSLSRVDVRLGQSTWTLKGISDLQLYPGVEVVFRRESPPALLFVSVAGRVALVA